MTSIWQHLQSDICPRLSKAERTLYIDLADPEFRLIEDVREALQCLSRFAQWFHTILSLNQKEAGEIMEILGLCAEGTDRPQIQKSAEVIRSGLGIQSVVVHPMACAAAATANESALVEGPYVERPLISTGAGDHFNAGYALGSILRGTPEQCLQLAVATSGYYVRTAKSPTLNELRKFLKEIA
jgi:sugar/nucleoside kinase (ribokinase family)